MATEDTFWQDQYRTCRVCEDPVSPFLFECALKRYERQVCSSACREREQIQRYGCCDLAELAPCVCMVRTSCPLHGDRHVGTHD